MARMRYPRNKSHRNQGGRVWQAAQSEFGILILRRATHYGLRPHRAPDTRAGREGIVEGFGEAMAGAATPRCDAPLLDYSTKIIRMHSNVS